MCKIKEEPTSKRLDASPEINIPLLTPSDLDKHVKDIQKIVADNIERMKRNQEDLERRQKDIERRKSEITENTKKKYYTICR
jgi:hypothetical protein